MFSKFGRVFDSVAGKNKVDASTETKSKLQLEEAHERHTSLHFIGDLNDQFSRRMFTQHSLPYIHFDPFDHLQVSSKKFSSAHAAGYQSFDIF